MNEILKKNMRPVGKQIAAARALLGMKQPELAELANISVPLLKRIEYSEGEIKVLENNFLAVISALKECGITFERDENRLSIVLELRPHSVDSSPSQPGDQPAKKGQDRND